MAIKATHTVTLVRVNDGDDAITCRIISSATVFTKIKLEDNTMSITPNTIILTPTTQNCNFVDWYYSFDGASYVKVTTGQNGLTIGADKTLTITNSSNLFDSYTTVIFRLTTNVATCQDTITITKTTDNNYIDSELGDIKDKIEQTTNTVNTVKSEMNALEGTIQDRITSTTTTLIDGQVGEIKEQIAILTSSVNGLDITTITNNVNNLTGRVENIEESVKIGSGKIEIGVSNSEIKMVLTNDKLSFQQGGTDIAYISSKMLFIQSALILTDITVGNDTHGYYRWALRSNGNYSLVYKKGL